MFSKKIALLGAAGLAALSISCSDDEGDNGAGVINVFIKEESNEVKITGTVEANDATNTVSAVAVTVEGKTGVNFSPALPSGIGTKTVTFNNGIENVCATAGSTEKKSLKFVVTATFATGSPTSETYNVTVDCVGAAINDPALIKQSGIVLSNAGESYADLDANPVATFKEAQATSAANIAKIDIVAYNRTIGGNKIYTPLSEPADLFYNDDFEYVGEIASLLYPLPSEALEIIKNATKESDIADFKSTLPAYILATEDVEEITVANNTGFLVSTTEGNIVAVIITASGTSTVTLSTTAVKK